MNVWRITVQQLDVDKNEDLIDYHGNVTGTQDNEGAGNNTYNTHYTVIIVLWQ